MAGADLSMRKYQKNLVLIFFDFTAAVIFNCLNIYFFANVVPCVG